MKKKLFYVAIFIATLNTYAQITFEKGYFINNSGEKTECLIKNEDWKNNPSQFIYKEISSSIEKRGTINLVREFSIYNFSKFVRESVDIDMSRNNINYLSRKRAPIFKKKVVFLKTLVKGNANLYVYQDSFLIKFFFSKRAGRKSQLVYKKYTIDGDIVENNNQYKQQLATNLKSPRINKKEFNNLRYNKKGLINIFNKYNQITDSKPAFKLDEEKKNSLNVSLKLGYKSSSLSLNNPVNEINLKHDNENNFRFGIEVEYLFSFNKNKWSIFTEPRFQKFKSTKTIDTSLLSGSKLTSKIDYTSIEIPIGIRHYMFLNKKSKLFINLALVFDLSQDSSASLTRADGSSYIDLPFDTQSSLSFGIGYKYNDKLSFELNAQTGRKIVNHNYWGSNYQTTSLSLGYSFL